MVMGEAVDVKDLRPNEAQAVLSAVLAALGLQVRVTRGYGGADYELVNVDASPRPFAFYPHGDIK
jgi:hypothetical protein